MTPEQEANAALFAAAPALAEALAGIIGMINRHPDLTVADLTIAADIAREALTLAGLADDPAAAPCRTCGEPAGLHGIGCPEHLADLAGLEVERPDPWS